MTMSSSQSVASALEAYYQANGFSAPALSRRWEWLELGPIRFPILNSAARVRALRLHDLHHLATGYLTDLRGEGEQSAWELAAGCHHHWFAWGINAIGAAMGVVLAPVRTWRAWRRGRRCMTLYSGEFDPALLELTVGELRAALGLSVDGAS